MGLTFDVAKPGDGGAGLVVVDYRAAAVQVSTFDNDGALTARFDPVPDGCLWRVERIVVHCTSTTDTVAALYVGDPSPLTLIDSTQAGNLDTADECSPILVDSSVVFTCQWINADPGSVATIRIQYQLVKRV